MAETILFTPRALHEGLYRRMERTMLVHVSCGRYRRTQSPSLLPCASSLAPRPSVQYFDDERKTEMKGVFDLQQLESCISYTDPPLLVLVVGSDCEMRLQAPSHAEAKTWLKFFLVASPNCRVKFKQDSASGFGTPLSGSRTVQAGSSSPLSTTTAESQRSECERSTSTAAAATAAVASASVK